MPYDLAKFRLQPGDDVIVLAGRIGMSMYIVFENGKNVVKAKWGFAKGNRGKVARLWQPKPAENVPPWIIVTSLPEFGHGEHTYAAKYVFKVEDGC